MSLACVHVCPIDIFLFLTWLVRAFSPFTFCMFNPYLYGVGYYRMDIYVTGQIRHWSNWDDNHVHCTSLSNTFLSSLIFFCNSKILNQYNATSSIDF